MDFAFNCFQVAMLEIPFDKQFFIHIFSLNKNTHIEEGGKSGIFKRKLSLPFGFQCGVKRCAANKSCKLQKLLVKKKEREVNCINRKGERSKTYV